MTAGDIIDVHAYGEAEFLGSSPRVAPSFVDWIAAAQVAGFPLAITEWNVPPPARDRFVAPLYVASLSALQGWDMPMLYAYQQYSVDARPNRPDQWSSSIDPALTALMPAAAVMVRQGHVSRAKRTYRLELSREQLYYQDLGPDTSATIRTLTEQSRIVIGLPDIEELDWDEQASASAASQVVVTDVDQDFIPPGATFVESDTGELKRDWAQGVHSIDTPMSQAASGWLGRRTVALSDVVVSLQTPKASVAVTSLDSKPISRSESMLLTTVAQITTSAGGRLPFRAEPVLGVIRIRSEHAGLCAYPVATDGQLFDPIALKTRDGVAEFVLPSGFRTHWYAIHPQSAGLCQKRARFSAAPSGSPAH